MSTPTEARELELVGKVEMKIALARDDKLEPVLKVYLPPLLLKLGSEHVAVRNKVISTCQHIKIRLAGNLSIVLPVAALLKQYKDNPQSLIIRHFDLLFIQQSIGKLSSSEQLELLPVLLHGIAEDAGKATCATIFNLFLRLLPRLRMPARGSKDDSDLRSKLGLDNHEKDARFVAFWFSKLVLLTIIKSDPGAGNQVTCPGLQTDEYSFLTLDRRVETWDPSAPEGLSLVENKVLVLGFLASGAFTHEERFLPAVFAAADYNSRIYSIGEDLLKRTTVSLEDEALAKELLDLCSTARPALQVRLLTLLSKSTAAARFPVQIISIVQSGIETVSGLEAKKLRSALFNFINWVSRVGTRDNLEELAPTLMTFLKDYIEGHGWPIPSERNADEATLRALAYDTLGAMAKTVPTRVRQPDLQLVRWLFRSLTEDTSSENAVISIQSALAGILSVFAAPLEPDLVGPLRALLLDYMTKDEGEEIVRNARFIAVRWANRCLNYDDIVGRWIDILAIAGRNDEKNDVVEEGTKGLDPYWYRLTKSYDESRTFSFPQWNELVRIFFSSHSMLEHSHFANTMKTGMEVDGISVFGNFPGTKIEAFPQAVAYCRQLLLLRALDTDDSRLSQEADWERQLDVLLRTDKVSRAKIRSSIRTLETDSVATFLTSAFEGILWHAGQGLKDCGKTFVEICALAPSSSLRELAVRVEELRPAIQSNTTATRGFAAHATGILVAHPVNDIPKIRGIIQQLQGATVDWSKAIGSDANKVHGSVLALAFVFSRLVFYGREAEFDDDLYQGAVSLLLDILQETKDASLKDAVLESIGHLATANILTPSRIRAAKSDVKDIVKILSDEAKKGHEKAIVAMGRLALVFDDSGIGGSGHESHLRDLVQDLYSLHEIRQTETQFTVGEALACAAACWQSDALQLSFDVDAKYVSRNKRPELLKSMMDKVLADCKTTKPSLKKAAGIWLFCLIQYCGSLDEIQSRLRECQAAFMGLLSARDDLVQETASRGLSLVYEQGDRDLREYLVSDLVASFTGSSTKIKVDEDTELFEPGALPTSEGESITSYKDIMSLAAEVGDQSLVYKFMSLASNAATWSTRAAFGRFGLSSILSESEVDPKLYPKLYRYRFDPNPNVQRSMNDIWSALVKNPSVIINEHFDAIMDDLLKSILGKEWRTRQASCAAIADLVQGRTFDKYEKFLSQIWDVAFKVLDDIKGSVRKAAEKLCQVLTGILVRQLEQGVSSKNARAMLEQVMPFLFSTRGLESSSKDVQAFAYDTVLKLIKSGGKNLLPFIPTVIEQILGLLSTLEPEAINYIHMNAAKYDTTEEKIDEVRSSIVSQSPMMEAVERCLDLLDESTMKTLVPHLETVIKTAVGMPSKIGCSGVLVSLATRHSFVYRPHADVFLKDIERAVLDRNATVSAAYARAAGYIARLASDSSLLRLGVFAKTLYFEAEDESRRQIAADVVYAVSKFATDRFNAMASEFQPFVFLAKHDFDEHVQAQFTKTWDENVGGSRAVLLYLKEITSLATERLESPKWTIKHTAALTIADVVVSAGNDISSTNAAIIWPALDKALTLKTFEGKERLLQAFVKFIKAAPSFVKQHADVATQSKKVAIREAKRNNEVYRPHAFNALGEYAELRTELEIFDDALAIIEPRVSELLDEDRMDTTSDDKDKSKSNSSSSSVENATLTASVNALFRSLNVSSAEAVKKTMRDLEALLQILNPLILTSQKAVMATKMALYERIAALFAAAQKAGYVEQQDRYQVVQGFLTLLELKSGAGTEAIRTKRIEAATALGQCAIVQVFGTSDQHAQAQRNFLQSMRDELQSALRDERSSTVRNLIETALAKMDPQA